MIRTLIFVLLSFAFFNCKAQKSDSLIFSINLSYGVDLSDTYSGIMKNGEKRNLASVYLIELESNKRWLGASIFLNIYRNTYYEEHPDILGLGADVRIPKMISGGMGGFMGFITPVNEKHVIVKLKVGAIYGEFGELNCKSYSYGVIDGKTIIYDPVYEKISKSGFGFSYGVSLLFPVTPKIAISTFFRADDFANSSSMSTYFNAGLGLTINI